MASHLIVTKPWHSIRILLWSGLSPDLIALLQAFLIPAPQTPPPSHQDSPPWPLPLLLLLRMLSDNCLCVLVAPVWRSYFLSQYYPKTPKSLYPFLSKKGAKVGNSKIQVIQFVGCRAGTEIRVFWPSNHSSDVIMVIILHHTIQEWVHAVNSWMTWGLGVPTSHEYNLWLPADLPINTLLLIRSLTDNTNGWLAHILYAICTIYYIFRIN